METYQPEVIQRLFLKQMRNLTKYGTVYAPENTDNFESIDWVQEQLQEDLINNVDAAIMTGLIQAGTRI